MSTDWFDRQGRPCSMLEWTALRKQPDYHRVALTRVGPSEVSTVWIGLDMGFGRRPGGPVIFETMVFGGPMDGECWRYQTEDEAHIAHEVIAAEVEASIRRLRIAGMKKRKRDVRQRHNR